MSLQANAQATQRARKQGRPTLFSQAIADEICDRLAEGEALDQICDDAYMPSPPTVRRWCKTAPAFSAEYARAKLEGISHLAEEALAIADAPCIGSNGDADNAIVQKQRLQVDTRKWYLSKLLPKQFGDKVTAEITGDPDAPLVTRIELVGISAKRLEPPTIEAAGGCDGGYDPSPNTKP